VVRLALAVPFELEDRLSPSAERHGHDIVARCSSAHELASRIESVRPDVVVVAATERHLTESLLALCDEAGVRVLALVNSEVERRHAASLGLLETADAASDWSELEGLLAVIPDRAPQPVAGTVAPERGTIIAVWGPAGAPGRTSVAINIAAELAAAGHSVALADVDTYSGSIAPASAGTSGASAPARSSVAIRRKMSPRNCSSSLVKPMMLTSGERRSWLTI